MSEHAFVPERPAAREYTDRHDTELAGLQVDQENVRRRLGQYRRAWQQWLPRKDEPRGSQELDRLAPLIVELEERDEALSQQMARVQTIIQKNRTAVVTLASRVADCDRLFGPVIARLHVSDDELIAAWTCSRDISVEARELLASTGDRQFRRTPDPADDIRAAAEDVLRRLDRVRARRGQLQGSPAAKEIA